MNARPATDAPTRRAVRFADIDVSESAPLVNAIQDMYDDELDVLIVRRALPQTPLERAGETLDRDDPERGWARPNERMPVEDIQLLGTDTPATPTYSAPAGASLDTYLASAAQHESATTDLFDRGFDARASIERALARFSGGRPVEVSRASDGRTFVPYTVRRLVHGKQIGLHHDYHYPLALYSDLVPRVDTRTLISYVVTLRRPETGGDLCVYGITPDMPDAPKMPNGFSWDLQAAESRFDFKTFSTNPGDLFLLASGRCLHRVSPISGPRARVTMGGFLALSKDRDRVYYWS